ncbi:unnamed protein product [Lactuca virosa]|uniref:Uncharacterized protein n=1 Tax=Lactuca virosa TaxID=75947 RepID=A0AAU9LK72_9ASTR|nr:unnamed protein product [Lactuca virosa]
MELRCFVSSPPYLATQRSWGRQSYISPYLSDGPTARRNDASSPPLIRRLFLRLSDNQPSTDSTPPAFQSPNQRIHPSTDSGPSIFLDS